MKARSRAVAVLCAAVGSLLLTPPAAQAGNWAETVLDPTPARLSAGTTYPVGYWVLQHGSYPYQGQGGLGPTALIFTDEAGAARTFPGVEFGADGHYAAEVVLPHDGTWLITATQGRFQVDEVGRVELPGAIELLPSQVRQRAEFKWGAAKPSFLPVAPDANAAAPNQAVPATPKVVTARTPTAGEPLPAGLLAGSAVALLALAGLLVVVYRKRNRRST